MSMLANAIRKMIELKGMNIFDNANIFISIIDDLIPELIKERNICHRVICKETLNLIKNVEMSDVNQRNKAIARCRYYICEEQGINEEWYEIIISAFDEALSWNIVTREFDNYEQRVEIAEKELHIVSKSKLEKKGAKTNDLFNVRDRISAIQGKCLETDTYTIGLKKDGTVITAGNENYGQLDTNKWENIVAVSIGKGGEVLCSLYRGSYHTVGLKADGTVVAVGENEVGQCNVSNWTDIIAISAGYKNTVGLKSDGTVVAVGDNQFGQCNVNNWENIIAISSYCHTVGLKADGTVVAVGENKAGQCDVSNWTDIVSICASEKHTVGLKADGTVVAVGENKAGQCKVLGWKDIIGICVGKYSTIGIKSDGTVVATGNNSFGQLKVSNWNNIVAICAGNAHTIGLKQDGSLVFAGKNDYGQCDVSGWNLFKNIGGSKDIKKGELKTTETFENKGISYGKKNQNVDIVDENRYIKGFSQSTINYYMEKKTVRNFSELDKKCMAKVFLYINEPEIVNDELGKNREINILVLGKKVKKIDDEAFKEFDKLEYIYILGGNDLHIGKRSFSGCKDLKVVIMNRVPDEDKSSQSMLKSFFNKEETYFSSDAFEGCGYIEWFVERIVRKKQNYLMQYCKANKFGYYTIVESSDDLAIKDDNFLSMWSLLRIEFWR